MFLATLGMRTFRLAEPAQMHFDEVYHARTATEFLQGWRYDLDHDIYEWTHPHLAKYAMAGGIVLLSVMLLFMDPLTAIPLHGVVQLVANGSRTWIQRSHVEPGIVWRYSLLLVALVIPIAIVANIIRIVTLVLLTYFFGDAVAQGFLHMAAGIFLFVTALLLVFAVDSLLSRLILKPKATAA